MVLLVLSLSPGCLSSSYNLNRSELIRLASEHPSTRWHEVRVTQRMIAGERPAGDVVTLAQPNYSLVPEVYLGRSVQRGFLGPGHLSLGRISGGGGLGSAGASSGGGNSNLDPRVVLVAVVLIGAVVFILAASEGARYDGWLSLEPHEMVYLETDEGVRAVPLSALTLAMAQRAYGATVYEGSQERFGRVGRAPLNRVGGTIQAAIGGAGVPRASSSPSFGVGGSAFVGGFFIQQLGLGLATDLAGADGNLYATVGPELQLMPLTHLGVYASAGFSGLLSATGSSFGGSSLRAGIQGEIPVSTRLTVRLRAGASRAELSGVADTHWLSEFSAGMSVY